MVSIPIPHHLLIPGMQTDRFLSLSVLRVLVFRFKTAPLQCLSGSSFRRAVWHTFPRYVLGKCILGIVVHAVYRMEATTEVPSFAPTRPSRRRNNGRCPRTLFFLICSVTRTSLLVHLLQHPRLAGARVTARYGAKCRNCLAHLEHLDLICRVTSSLQLPTVAQDNLSLKFRTRRCGS